MDEIIQMNFLYTNNWLFCTNCLWIINVFISGGLTFIFNFEICWMVVWGQKGNYNGYPLTLSSSSRSEVRMHDNIGKCQ
jgi:hypothetical protein